MPAGGSRQSAPAESQANVLDASSGILPWADAPVLIAKVKSAATGRSVLRTRVKVDIVPSISSGFCGLARNPESEAGCCRCAKEQFASRSPHAGYRGDVAVLLAAHIVLDPQVVAQI